jgi:coenzyme F420-reducing hydrogenase beta subunit
MTHNDSITNVIDNNFCIGCGTCAVIPNPPFVINMNKYGMYEALPLDLKGIDEVINDKLSRVCPFGNHASDEDVIAKAFFSDDCFYSPMIGYYSDIYAGYVIEDKYRLNGSSGGFATWLATELLNQGYINGVLHVKTCKSKDNDRIFKYQISQMTEEIKNGAKSKYYPIEMSEVLKKVLTLPGKFAIVGLPCFIKSIRLLSKEYKLFSEKIIFTFSLFCGHLKSKNYLDYLIRKMRVDSNHVIYIDFRKKIEGNPANDYFIEIIENKTGKLITHTARMKDLIWNPWGTGIFKYKACDYCDDVVGETADISLGDAWLPKYIKDSFGTSLVIVRNKIISNIINQAIISKKVHTEKLLPADVVASQLSNFRYRKEEIAYRLYLLKKNKLWYPKKRVSPNSIKISNKRKKIQYLKLKISKSSHMLYINAQESKDITLFDNSMFFLFKKYKQLQKRNLIKRALFKLKKLIRF